MRDLQFGQLFIHSTTFLKYFILI